MPAYKTFAQPTACYFGDSFAVWNGERPLSGVASERIAVPVSPDGSETDISIQLLFAAAPGAYQVDFQASDTDVDSAYVTQNGTSMTAVNAGFSATMWIHVKCLFARLIMTTQSANAVNLTAKITR